MITHSIDEVIGWLESGEYTQAQGGLIEGSWNADTLNVKINRDNLIGHCCLGVMCDKIDVPLDAMANYGVPASLKDGWASGFKASFPWCDDTTANRLAGVNDDDDVDGGYIGPIALLRRIKAGHSVKETP